MDIDSMSAVSPTPTGNKPPPRNTEGVNIAGCKPTAGIWRRWSGKAIGR
ncbi:hypothetical protein P7F60_21280 [Rhizobium sp. YJ-22]|nr:hypothetical protein [Rhizobium sp. YJ-22]MDG3578926.1 hypothetical protein [Rhizobium sp. YJ-22]